MTFRVDGLPATKGSTRSFAHARTGKIITLPDAKGLAAWTAAVKRAALAARVVKLTGAVRCSIVFDLPAPQRLTRGKGGTMAGTPGAWITVEALPSDPSQVTTRPDGDKLLRAVLDSLTGIAFLDDGQVTEIHASKRYALAGVGVVP